MFRTKAKINYNRNIKKNYYEISLSAPQIASIALPGQFVNIKVSEGFEPLLRRPLSIHRISKSQIVNRKLQDGIKILYEVIGEGTKILSRKRAGEILDVIGPLGNGFTIDGRRATGDGRRILVAGGMGTAPLIFLAEKLREIKNQKSKIKILVLIGAKTKNQILCEKEFEDLGYEVKIATDDGSKGFKGRVTDLLKDILPLAISHKPLAIYACGPKPMLREISSISLEYNVPAQISLEAHMACGIGVCMGCVIKTHTAHRTPHTEYVRVCKEGPVFEAGQIIW